MKVNCSTVLLPLTFLYLLDILNSIIFAIVVESISDISANGGKILSCPMRSNQVLLFKKTAIALLIVFDYSLQRSAAFTLHNVLKERKRSCRNPPSEHCKGLLWRISARAFTRYQKLVQCECTLACFQCKNFLQALFD